VIRRLAAVALPCAALAAIVIYSAANSSSHRGTSTSRLGRAITLTTRRLQSKPTLKRLVQALERIGFFNGRGKTVKLSKGKSGKIISFVLNDGAWDQPMALLTFEGIACRVAASTGGFPLQVRLCDRKWRIRKKASVGRALVGTKTKFLLRRGDG